MYNIYKLDFICKERIIREGIQRKYYYMACASTLGGRKYYYIAFSSPLNVYVIV